MKKLVACVCLLACASFAFAADLADVKKDLSKAWSKHKSMTADMQFTQNIDMGGMKISVKGDGTVESLTKGDKTLVRMEMKVVQTVGDGGQQMEMTLSSINDEEYSYILVSQMGQQMAMKQDLDPSKSPSPDALFPFLEKENELKLQEDAEVDGAKCYVVDVIPKEKEEGNPMAVSKQRYYFDKESGAVRKLEMYGPEDKLFMTVKYTNIKFDTDLDPKRFKFEAPEGVTVQDQTKKTDATEPAPAAEPQEDHATDTPE